MSITIEKGQLFKRMFCHHCGTKLKYKSVTFTGEVVPEKWEEYIKKMKKATRATYSLPIFIPSITDTRFAYECPKCGSITTPKTQLKIRHHQKVIKSKIIPQKQIDINPMLKKRTYTDDELFWACSDESDWPSYLYKPKNIK